MSRPEAAVGANGPRRDERAGTPLRVVSERLPQDGDDPHPDLDLDLDVPVEPIVPRVRAAGRPITTPPHPTPVPPPGVPAPPLAALTDGLDVPAGPVPAGAPLPVLAPRAQRFRLRTLIRTWFPSRQRGRHRTGAPHIKAAWSMFAPHRQDRRRRSLF